MALTNPERNSDDQYAGDKKTERGSVTDIDSASADCLRQSAVRYEEQQKRRGNRLDDTLCKDALVEE